MASTAKDESVSALGVFADLPIAKEATTSRVLVNNPLLRVVTFSFDTDQVLTDHSSPRAVVVTMLEGTLDFSYDGQTHAMSPGDTLYLAPGVRHAVHATSPCRMQLVLIDA